MLRLPISGNTTLVPLSHRRDRTLTHHGFLYIVHMQGVNGSIRDQVLLQLRTPILFIQGSKDKMCPLPQLAAVREQMQCKSDLLVVEGGDHSLRVTDGAKTPIPSSLLTVLYPRLSTITATYLPPGTFVYSVPEEEWGYAGRG